MYLSTVSDASFSLETSPKGRRASTSPYPHILSLLVEAFPLYQHLSHACTPLPYPFILQLTFLFY